MQTTERLENGYVNWSGSNSFDSLTRRRLGRKERGALCSFRHSNVVRLSTYQPSLNTPLSSVMNTGILKSQMQKSKQTRSVRRECGKTVGAKIWTSVGFLQYEPANKPN